MAVYIHCIGICTCAGTILHVSHVSALQHTQQAIAAFALKAACLCIRLKDIMFVLYLGVPSACLAMQGNLRQGCGVLMMCIEYTYLREVDLRQRALSMHCV